MMTNSPEKPALAVGFFIGGFLYLVFVLYTLLYVYGRNARTYSDETAFL